MSKHITTTPKHTTKSQTKPWLGIKNDQPSQTIQGDSMSLADIITRYQRTGEITRNHAEYIDCDIDDITQYHRQGNDFTDLDDVKEYVADLQLRIKLAEKETKNAKLRDPNTKDLFDHSDTNKTDKKAGSTSDSKTNKDKETE